jgi:hypothetical protein
LIKKILSNNEIKNIDSIRLPFDLKTNEFKGYGFIKFEENQKTFTKMLKLNGLIRIDDQEVFIDNERNRFQMMEVNNEKTYKKAKTKNQFSVLISNIPSNTNELEIHNAINKLKIGLSFLNNKVILRLSIFRWIWRPG